MTALSSFAKRSLKALTPDPLIRRWHAFRWPYRCVRWLPGTSRLYGPARRWTHSADYLRHHPGTRREVLAAQTLATPQFFPGNNIPSRFFARLQRDIPPAYVLRLPEVRLMGVDGWVVGARDSFLLDASYHVRPDAGMNFNEHYMLRRRRSRPVRRLGGRTLSLASDFACGGFAHFIHDSLCRLHLIELAGIDPADFDHIFWPRLHTTVTDAVVRATGIDPARIVEGDPTHDFSCEDLTATTFPGLPAHLTPCYVDFLRRRFAPPPLGHKRRLYLARGGFRRNFRNSTEIDAVLASAGYETCWPHSDPDVLAKCAAASHLVALEGSNFFNAFAAAPGTRALIILPEAGQTLPFTLSLATAAGFETHLLVARSLIDGTVEPSSADVHLDPALLARTLERMARVPSASSLE